MHAVHAPQHAPHAQQAHQIRLESDTGHLLRSCETNLEFSTLWSVERRSKSGNVLESEEVAAARRQGLSEQERSSATLPVPTLTSLRVSQMEKRKVRHRNHVPQDGQRGGSLVQMSYVLLNATGEHAELHHEECSAAVALVHVRTDCRVSPQCRTRVSELQKTTFSLSLLGILCNFLHPY